MKVINTLKEQQKIICDKASSYKEAAAAFDFSVAYARGVADAFDDPVVERELNCFIHNLEIILSETEYQFDDTDDTDDSYFDNTDDTFDEVGYDPYSGCYGDDL